MSGRKPQKEVSVISESELPEGGMSEVHCPWTG